MLDAHRDRIDSEKLKVREHNYITISSSDARGRAKARSKSVRFDEIKFYQQ
jgi:hypothetical protein